MYDIHMTQLSTTLTASNARSNFYQILANAVDNLNRFTIKIRGKGDAIIMSKEELESWEETLDILSNKKLANSLRKALRSKKTYTQEEVYKKLGW